MVAASLESRSLKIFPQQGLRTARCEFARVELPRARFRCVPRARLSWRSLRRLVVVGLVGFSTANLALAPVLSRADEADAIAVDLKCRKLICDFAVTLRHADDGWEHYADAWEVLSEERELLAKRVLRHPHVKEQPFTRSLPGVALPVGTTRVIIRGHDKLHGYGGAELRVEIPTGVVSPVEDRKQGKQEGSAISTE
jgi:hypothetical protein